MITWDQIELDKECIKKELGIRAPSKNGNKQGFYYLRSYQIGVHRHDYSNSRFYYSRNNVNEREIAKLNAIDEIKKKYWKRTYIIDFPNTTPEFIGELQNLEFDNIYIILDKIRLFNQRPDLLYIQSNNRILSESIKVSAINFVREKIGIGRDLFSDISIENMCKGSYYLAFIHFSEIELGELLREHLKPILEVQISGQRSDGRGRERPILKSLKREIINRDGGICQQCSAYNEKYEIDHVIPVSIGGTSSKWNLQLLCRKCNQKKSGHLLYDHIIKAIERLQSYLHTKQ